jgi:hypothetical protein
MFDWLRARFRKRRQALSPEAAWRVDIDGASLTVTWPEGSQETVDLNALRRVLVVTNDSGPWGQDVWFVIEDGHDAACSFPLGATGQQEALERLHKLPGFQLRGMNCTENFIFECWPNPNADPVPHEAPK